MQKFNIFSSEFGAQRSFSLQLYGVLRIKGNILLRLISLEIEDETFKLPEISAFINFWRGEIVPSGKWIQLKIVGVNFRISKMGRYTRSDENFEKQNAK